ncbi:MAG: hypothetical protein IPK82_14900 [Polyangiaceae bacterium]|nr:hypothetical protein [Polyangiaceae bacterium]
MSEAENLFTVEVLGFPTDADPDEIAAAVASLFGIPVEEGRRLVRKVPVRVKRNASADTVRTLVKQLKSVGADVLVRNEGTGDERTYRAASTGPVSEPSPHVAPPEETLESDDGAAPDEPAPQVAVLTAQEADARRVSTPGVEGPISSDRASPLELTSPSAREPTSPRASAPSRPGDTGPVSDAGISSNRKASALSLPPPSSPVGTASIPAPPRTSLDYCGSCKGPVEKGDTCSRCGFNNASRIRHCRSCKKPLSLVSKITKEKTLAGLIGVGSLAMAGGFGFLFGPVAGVAGVLLGAAIGFLGDGLTLRYACRACAVAVYTERLLKEEEAKIASGRRRSFAIAVVAGALAIAAFVVPAGASKQLTAASFNATFVVDVPAGYGKFDSDVASVDLPAGGKRMRLQYADKSFLSGPTYVLGNLQLIYPALPAEPDKPSVQAALEQTVSKAWNGTLNGKAEPSGDGFRAQFSGSFRGKAVSGVLFVRQDQHDIVLTAVFAPQGTELGANADRFLMSVRTERAPTK